MAGFNYMFIALNLLMLAAIAVYLCKQFINKLEYEQDMFEKTRRSTDHEEDQ